MILINIIKQHNHKISDTKTENLLCDPDETFDCIVVGMKRRFKVTLNEEEKAALKKTLDNGREEFKLNYKEKDYFYKVILDEALVFDGDDRFSHKA